MSTFNTSVRNAALDAITALLNGGTLRIGTTGMAATLATLNLSATAFQSASDGAATANEITSTTISQSGTVGAAGLYDSSGTAIISEITVGTSGQELNFSSLNFIQGGNISVSSLVLTLSVS